MVRYIKQVWKTTSFPKLNAFLMQYPPHAIFNVVFNVIDGDMEYHVVYLETVEEE